MTTPHAAESRGTILRRILHHTWPMLVAQLLSMSMMVADTVITGRYHTDDLAAVAIGSGLYISVVMLLVGILQAVAPIAAHHYGAKRNQELGPTLQQGFWLALFLALPGVAVLAWPDAILAFSRVPEQVRPIVQGYLQATALGLPAVLLYRTFYAFTNALGRPRVLMAISLATTASHIPLAWSLVHGRLLWAPMGAVGCGVSSAVSAWLALGLGLAWLRFNPAYRPYRLFETLHPPRLAAQWELLRLGLPMGLSTFIEITSFTLISLFIARLGAETVAGHRVVANLMALLYMLPLSLAVAVMVLVGQAAGAHDHARVARTIRVGVGLGAAVCGSLGVLLWFAQGWVVALATPDPAVAAVALGLVVYVCIYQLFDALQTVASHALRGLKVTLAPMLLHTLCFWGIGLGGGYWLSFHAFGRAAQPSVAGFWEAGVLSTLVASALFGGLLFQVLRQRGVLQPA